MDEPTELLQAWIGMHELFVTAVKAGFTEYQASVIIGVMMAAAGQGAQGEEGAGG
jgi:hypothetical protein